MPNPFGDNIIGGRGPGGGNGIDPKMFGALLAAGITLVLVIIGDKAAFVAEPKGFLQYNCGAVVASLYLLTGDRIMADVLAFVFFGGFLTVVVVIAWQIISRKILEPISMKRMIDAKKRQKKIINEYGDDTL